MSYSHNPELTQRNTKQAKSRPKLKLQSLTASLIQAQAQTNIHQVPRYRQRSQKLQHPLQSAYEMKPVSARVSVERSTCESMGKSTEAS